MKRYIILLGWLMMSAITMAQNPSWAKKATNAVFTLKTFNADGALLASVNGFFIGENGEAVSSFAPFKNAQRAVIIDAKGKEMAVECLTGFNDMYDVAKFKVANEKRTEALKVTTYPTATEAIVWLMPYSAKKNPACIQGKVSQAEQFGEGFAYYTLAMESTEQHVGSPILNEDGEVMGILQPSADSRTSTSFAVSARFANSLAMKGLTINDPALQNVHIDKALPDDKNEATVTLYMAGSSMTKEEYAKLVDRFIAKFPEASDGYIYRARIKADNGDFQGADEDMHKAVKVADPKDEAHYQYAQMIYQKNIFQSDKVFEPWSLDAALKESQEAYNINQQPLYQQQQANILFAQQKYEDAEKLYMELVKNDFMKAESYYAAAQCKKQMNDQEGLLALLDSAVNTFTKPYIKTAAPYLLARAQAYFDCKKFRPAVSDYNDYESLMATQVNANFYFMREQAEVAGHLFQQALNDINKAIEMEPKDIVYQAEKANLQLRVGMTDEAMETAKGCIQLNPEGSDGYLLLGLAQCVKGNKAEGLQNLNKAKELGNSQAQSLIDKYSK